LLVLIGALCAGADDAAGVPTRAYLHSLFQDHMVLQRGKPVPVWGWSDPGAVITVRCAGATVTATGDADGRWLASLPAMAAGGPHVLEISGPRSVTISDVLVGDVWVCSGQSNMQGTLDKADIAGNAEALAKADVPGIRFLTASPGNDNGSEVPLDDFGVTRGNWQVCSSQSADKLSRTAYFFGRQLRDHLKVPIGLIVPSLNGSPIESWLPRAALMSLPDYAVDGRFYAADDPFGEIIPHWHLPTARFNSLIHPLAPFAITGFLWYQGETNAAWRHPGDRYAKLLELLIRSWRACWQDDQLPFITIQLPATPRNKDVKEVPKRSGWAEVQDGQRQSLRLPRTGLTITMDLGDGDLHPKTKDKIGARAALAARQVAYGEAIVGMGPTFIAAATAGGAMRLTFANVGGGLVASDGEALRFFMIAGEDRRFVWATATIDGESVVVSSPQVAKPVAVRYGWLQNGLVNFVNREGLPASPLRSDNWDEVDEKTPRLRGPQGQALPWDGKVAAFPAAPLALLAQQGRVDLIAKLVAARPQTIAEWNASGCNVLNGAITAGHLNVVRQLIDLGIDASIPEAAGLYPLHRAVLHGRLDIAKLLIGQGAAAGQESRSPGRATPLFFAAFADQADCAALLLDHGALIDQGQQSYRPGSGIEPNPPLRAAFERTRDGATARLLLSRNAKLDVRFASGDGPLIHATRKNLPQVVATLLLRGIAIDETNNKQESALEAAAGAGNQALVELLLKHGAKPGERVLIAARKRSNNQAVLALLESPAP